jgi:NAD(P)H-hydrate epimerase
MYYVLNHEQMQACDRLTTERMGVPSLVLMERAALAVFDVICSRYPDCRRVLILCGSGNNGGDGFALARLLLLKGIRADVLFVGKHASMTEQTRTECAIFENYGGTLLPDDAPLKDYDLIADALFGIGLSRDIIGRYADLIRAVNRMDTPVISIDIPSGISADDGQVRGTAVRADCTVTFAFRKIGQILYPGAEYCGELILRDVGITDIGLSCASSADRAFCGNDGKGREDLPGSAEDPDTGASDGLPVSREPVCVPEVSDLASLLPRRRSDANKGTYGKLLLIAGKDNMAGAAVMAGEAACRTGCGLVCICSHEKNRMIIQSRLPEALFVPWDEDLRPWLNWADAIAIGPGLGKTARSLELLTQVLRDWHGSLVIDADALNLLAENPELIPLAGNRAVFTPHPGEMGRLAGCPAAEAAALPIPAAESYSRRHSCILVLKGARTIVTDGSDTMISTFGNEGMATGGSGDTLTGIVGSLLAQGLTPFDAARAGVCLHGLAGDAAADTLGSCSMLAGDIPRFLPQVFRAVRQAGK